VTACEDCGHTYVRLAEEDEVAEFERNKTEFGRERGGADV
jgi:hypothetical protein